MSRARISTYDEQIVPLLRQMTQLETLTLSLNVHKRTTFIDGTHLNNEILSQMPHLHTFIFDIVTHIEITNGEQQSIDDIQRTFVQDIGGYIDYIPHEVGRCHVYSLLFTMKYLHTITNNFPGGMFMSVCSLSVIDPIHSFEHDFFKRLSRSFPLLSDLTVFNGIQQKQKHISSIVEFPHLSKLNLEYAHMDYAEQFLLNTNSHLPCLNHLEIPYEHLINVTENFTNNAARVICAKVKRLIMTETIVHSQNFYLYFPLL